MLNFSFIRHLIEFLGIVILFFRTFRYDRGSVSEVSRFSWDADNSKLELTGEKPGAMKTADVLRRNATSNGKFAGGGEYEVQESPEHCLVTHVRVTRRSLRKLGGGTDEEVCCVGFFVHKPSALRGYCL